MIENVAGDVVGLEIKAAATVKERNLRGLKKLSKLVGHNFIKGILLYDGDKSMPLGSGIWAVPLSALWGS